MSAAENDVVTTLNWLAGLAPTRLTGTEGEKRVQQAIAERLERAGYTATWQPFRFSRHIYGSHALHFGLALLLVFVARYAPLVAGIGHLVVAISFYSEAMWRRHLLRLLWPRVATQNVLLTWPAKTALRRRLVFLAHTDSAFTGILFHPAVIRVVAAPPPRLLAFLRKQLMLPFLCLLALAALESIHPIWGAPVWLIGLLCFPLVTVFFFNIDVVLRNRPVPGAADNLSGCAAQVELAEAWARSAADDVEVVFGFTGAEEAGTGGAAHLSRTAGWDRAITEIIVLDTLSNGTLHLLEEGELYRCPMPPALREDARAAARDVGLPEPTDYIIPAGATDAFPFLIAGYRALALTCIDAKQHAPLNYHHPNDTADRVEPEQLRSSTRIASAFLERLARPPTAP